MVHLARDFVLITMPTHAGSFRRTLLGSTTAKVFERRRLSGTDHPASVSDRPVQLDLEEHLEPAKRDAASRRLAELQGTAGSHAPVRILIGAIGRLRDLTYAVVRDAPCPVLSI